MIALAQAHAHQIIAATAALLVALIAVLIWTVRHLERRLQHAEHEIADLRAALNLPATTPEVIKRYDAMQQQDGFKKGEFA